MNGATKVNNVIANTMTVFAKPMIVIVQTINTKMTETAKRMNMNVKMSGIIKTMNAISKIISTIEKNNEYDCKDNNGISKIVNRNAKWWM